MPFLVHVKTDSLRRLLASWWNPSKVHRQLLEGQMIAKLSSRNYLMDDRMETILVLADLKGRHPRNVAIYKISEEIDDPRSLLPKTP
jgi:hypothetical protein